MSPAGAVPKLLVCPSTLFKTPLDSFVLPNIFSRSPPTFFLISSFNSDKVVGLVFLEIAFSGILLREARGLRTAVIPLPIVLAVAVWTPAFAVRQGRVLLLKDKEFVLKPLRKLILVHLFYREEVIQE